MKNKFWMIATISLLLTGCQSLNEPTTLSLTSSSIDTQSESSTEEVLVDKRFVPELSQVELGLQELEAVKVGDVYFDLQTVLKQEQQAFDVVVEQMKVFEVNHADKEWMGEFAYETKPGAIILMHTAITNHSTAAMYFPIEELRLAFDDAMSKIAPSTKLYPLESGNLAEILMENNGEIAPGTTVDGYLIYGVGATSWQKMKSLGNFYVSVVPPRASLSELIGVGANKLGELQSFFLPLNLRTERQLNENGQFVQDRLTTEWWGTKHILAEATVNRVQYQGDATITLKRIEVADFEPRMKYEESFQNFSFGQVIVSIAYDVTNRGTTTLLPVDAEAKLLIGEDEIHSDYVLTNQTYGHEVAPNETYTVIKTFALDKKRYQLIWQDQAMKFVLPIPIEASEAESGTSETTSESSSEQEVSPVKKTEIIAEFDWQPQLKQWIDESLKRTVNGGDTVDSRSSVETNESLDGE